MIVVAVALALAIVLWRVRKSRRLTRLSGTVSDRPVFSVEPPRRRLGNLGDEVL